MCPLDSCKGSIGNCEFCSLKSECILITILNKLENLESIVVNQVPQNITIRK
jgi:hypothetical protein